jgi:hypothetical protein
VTRLDVRKAVKIGLCVLIGIAGAELASSVMLISLGVPASSAFSRAAWSGRLTDPIALVFAAGFYALGWVCLSRVRVFTRQRERLLPTHSFHSERDKPGAARHDSRRV